MVNRTTLPWHYARVIEKNRIGVSKVTVLQGAHPRYAEYGIKSLDDEARNGRPRMIVTA